MNFKKVLIFTEKGKLSLELLDIYPVATATVYLSVR
jgi:hypothetical protein